MEHSSAKYNRVSSLPHPEKIRMTREFIAGTLNLEKEAIGLGIAKLTLRIHIDNWIYQENGKDQKREQKLKVESKKDDRSFQERFREMKKEILLLQSGDRTNL